MAQQYIGAVRELGDERVIMLDGEPLGAIARVPREDEHRSNLHVGGTARKVVLGARERRICDRVGPSLRAAGLYFVGLDIIGDYLTEVNVTSPTGIQEIDRLDGVCLETKVIELVERKAAEAKAPPARIEKAGAVCYGPPLRETVRIPPKHGQVAQSVEQQTENLRVGGSIPPLPTSSTMAYWQAYSASYSLLTATPTGCRAPHSLVLSSRRAPSWLATKIPIRGV